LHTPPPQPPRLHMAPLEHPPHITQPHVPTRYSPHHFHPLQLTTAHGCPPQQALPGWRSWDISNESSRGHYQRVSTRYLLASIVFAQYYGCHPSSSTDFGGPCIHISRPLRWHLSFNRSWQSKLLRASGFLLTALFKV